VSHLTVFELKRFVDGVLELSDDDVRHVSACSTCAAQLQRLARRELALRSDVLACSSLPERTPTFAAMMAAAAALVGLLGNAHPPRTPDAGVAIGLFAPEGIHGVADGSVMSFGRHGALLADGGAPVNRD